MKKHTAAAHFSGEKRKVYVQNMFDSIAKRYDFLNHLLSGGIDILWRKRAVKSLQLVENLSHHLDVATGTGDFAFEIYNEYEASVIGLDLSKNMLSIAKKKLSKRKDIKHNKVRFLEGDAEKLPFGNDTFDSATIAFGIRNFGDKESALKEIHRVLKPNGVLLILEFTKIQTPIIKHIFHFYFRYFLPKIGAFFSKNKEAYSYLPESVDTFMSIDEFIKQLQKNFQDISTERFTFGISSLFLAKK